MLSVVLTVLASLTTPAAQKNADPALKGFDYRAVHRETASLVADGKGERAVELLDGLMVTGFGEDGKKSLQKEFALYFATGGKHLGSEVVGYRKFGSRVVKFYGVWYWEKRTALVVYVVVRDGESGEWKLQTVFVADKLDELDQVAPFVPLGPVKD